MPDWLVQIVHTGSGSAAFLPVQEGAQLGGALKARAGDNVIWRNLTDQHHQPWPTDDKFTPLPDADVKEGVNKLSVAPIAPHKPSSAAYSVNFKPPTPPGGTLYYCCKLHPEERGTIVDQAVGNSATPTS